MNISRKNQELYILVYEDFVELEQLKKRSTYGNIQEKRGIYEKNRNNRRI